MALWLWYIKIPAAPSIGRLQQLQNQQLLWIQMYTQLAAWPCVCACLLWVHTSYECVCVHGCVGSVVYIYTTKVQLQSEKTQQKPLRPVNRRNSRKSSATIGQYTGICEDGSQDNLSDKQVHFSQISDGPGARTQCTIEDFEDSANTW